MSDEAHLIKTAKGVFRLSEHPDEVPPVVRAMNVQTGRCFDFIDEAGALAWIKDEPGAPRPLAFTKPTDADLAKWESLERRLDAEYGADGDPLEDL